MRVFSKLFFIYVVAACMTLSGCSTTPKETKNNSQLAHVELTGDEQKSYQDAIEAIKSEHADKAIQLLTKIANNHPEHIGAWINLANANFTLSKIIEAETALTHAREINPKAAEIYNLQGLIAASKGEYTNAEKNYLNAIQIKANYPAAHYNLALLYDIYYQDLDKAVIQYDRYLELSDGTDKKTISWVAELKQKIKRRNK